jgi:thiamine biosynthesis lipoprotein
VDEATLVRRDFRAMGTEIGLIVPRAADAERRLQRAERWVHGYETRMSRFIAYSELTRLNRSGGRPFRASKMLFEFVRTCIELADRSHGVFDPTLLHEVEDAGYDRTFDMLPEVATLARRERKATYADIALDAESREISLPEGIGIDSGGLGKGWAADRVAAILGRPCLVDCGGDIAAVGAPPGLEAWYVAVQDPFRPDQDIAVLALVDRGVATSSTLKRRWRTNAGMAHHLIDSRTRLPSQTDVAAVSVIAPNATMADFHAKVALLQGMDAGMAYIEAEADTAALFVGVDGGRRDSRGLTRYLVQG